MKGFVKTMKSMKQFTAFLLVIILIFMIAACAKTENQTKDNGKNNVSNGKTEEKENAKGRYIETLVNVPEGFTGKGGMRRLANGSLMIVDTEHATKSISTDEGKTWKTETIKKLKSIIEGETEITSVALTEKGGIFISYVPWGKKEDGKMYPEKYFYQKPDKTIIEFELGIEEYHTSMSDSVFTADGRLFAVMQSMNVYEIDIEKKSAKKIFSLENGNDLDMCSNEDVLIIQDGKKVYFYDLNSGSITADDNVLNSYIEKQTEKKYGTVMCTAKGGKNKQTLYFAGSEGIASHAIGGSVMEQLVDGALTNLGDPSRTPLKMIQNQDGSFFILYRDGELDSYVYDANAPVVPEQQLTIYSLYDNETIRQAISVFRKKNPEVFVKFEVGLSGENGMTESDAINNLNTELLAGEGPDMILLDGMPIESYEEKGMLVDLGDVITDLESANAYFEGILKGYQQESGTYVLPFRYNIPLLTGDNTTLSKISDLKTLADEAERIAGLQTTKETVLGCYLAEELLEKLYLTSANVWITEDGTINKTALSEFLTQAKRIYEAEQKNLDEKERKAHEEMVGYYKKQSQDGRKVTEYLLKSGNQVMNQLSKVQILTAGYLSSMSEFQSVTSVKKLSGDEYKILNGQDSNIFCSTGSISISKNSRNQEIAKQFIHTLLGTEVQGKDLADGFPVNADAYENFTHNPAPDSSLVVSVKDGNGDNIMLDLEWPEQSEIEKLKTIIDSLKVPSVTDNSLKDEIITNGAQALTGEKGVEQSVEEIIQKISLHLQE
ncbi:MAG: extracellular solute-binding protein [Clostridiales bacterium]|nr:extracellular solute-binding protein [Clostridiales bacterium]